MKSVKSDYAPVPASLLAARDRDGCSTQGISGERCATPPPSLEAWVKSFLI